MYKKYKLRHAPRERVSWNYKQAGNSIVVDVTLHVSVWVEMGILKVILRIFARHAPRERVSWNDQRIGHQRSV